MSRMKEHAIKLVNTPQYLQYLEKEKETACAHVLSNLLDLRHIVIADIGLHPQLRLQIEKDEMSYSVVRYSKDKWRVYAINMITRDDIIRSQQEYELDLTPARFKLINATSRYEFKTLQEVIDFIKR